MTRPLRRQRPIKLRPVFRRKDNPIDRLSAELVRTHDTWVRIFRKAYSGPGSTPGDRFPGLPNTGPQKEHTRPTFVLIHGMGVSSRYFVKLSEDLSGLGEVFLIDMPGFANLPQPPEPLSIAGFAGVIHQVLVAHGVEKPIIIGHSMGAQVVTELMAKAPDYAQAGVLIGPPVNDAERNVALQVLRFAQSSVHESRQLRLIAVRAYLQCGIAWFLDVLPQMMRYPIEQRIPLVQCPTLLVRGEYDYICPTAWLEWLGAANPRVVSGAAHSVIYAHDTEIFGLITEFLETEVYS
ncbi:hypothetical protein BSZ39_00840 [Bowdeniella nasicola]|uniref:AB hydrolase-1 domain-containing protein n=1 Tax=Bowdeniella nasicola TaxID=208480 RepID=A0A1Q5Q5Y6_9ACTO|nr:alpha/beta hydrolase [Bowdeniella nasicola]OKL55109.1 hypothetical protein BSZ39_00840 [Bowdeniella nasicola]